MASDLQKTAVGVILILAFLGYSLYLYSALPMQDHSLTAQADWGKSLWQKHNCTACHQVYGLGGFLGPDLTNVYSVKGPDHIRAFIKTGTNTMPAYQLTEDETLALLAYFEHMDKTGSADPRSFTINIDGTIEQK